jgi:hypothetical protein
MQQVMDWQAAIVAGVIAGTALLLLKIALMNLVAGSSPWAILRQVAAIVLGQGVLPPPATFDPLVLLVALIVHFTLSIFLALLLAFIIHRWGLAVGIVGGALFGLAVYAITFYTFTIFFPWFFPVRSWIDILTLVIFGAVAGGVYEGLERERFVPA